MNMLVKHIKAANLAGRVITDRQIARLIDGTDARRHGLVNRAKTSGMLEPVRRGLYTLGDEFGGTRPHRYVVAQALRPGSYITAETALSDAAWIPEAVYTTTSIVPERKSYALSHERYGEFEFRPLAHNPHYFLVGVDRWTGRGGAALLASPLRALLDLVALRRQTWTGLEWITEGLRIDASLLQNEGRDALNALRPVYKHKRMATFINQLNAALHGDEASSSSASGRQAR